MEVMALCALALKSLSREPPPPPPTGQRARRWQLAIPAPRQGISGNFVSTTVAPGFTVSFSDYIEPPDLSSTVNMWATGASRAPVLLLLFSLFAALASALKFDLVAQPRGHRPRCIRNFVSKDTLVVVTATVSGSKGDGQQVNIHV